MADLEYTLAWPRPLFEWEAARVGSLGYGSVVEAARLLVSEAIEDESAVADLQAAIQADEENWSTTPDTVARAWLDALRSQEAKLFPRRAPVYFAERQGLVADGADENAVRFASAFVALIGELQESGYFPRALPRECVDAETDYDEVSRRIKRATKLDVSWPPTNGGEDLPESTVLTLIEYFHDQAQRPRVVERVHTFGGCGPHYGAHNRESGGVVYRWRTNELLEAYNVGYRLGSSGEERGRLIRSTGTPVDELANRQMQRRGDHADEVTHAIREFRRRGASLPEKRSAIRALSHALEPRRKEIGALLTKKDESDLFQIANAFAIRHNRDGQRTDYGEEFLDWTFWMHLATVELLDQLDRRARRDPET